MDVGKKEDLETWKTFFWKTDKNNNNNFHLLKVIWGLKMLQKENSYFNIMNATIFTHQQYIFWIPSVNEKYQFLICFFKIWFFFYKKIVCSSFFIIDFEILDLNFSIFSCFLAFWLAFIPSGSVFMKFLKFMSVELVPSHILY